MTRNTLDRGLAAMPPQERSSRIDARPDGGDWSGPSRHRETMARKTPTPISHPSDDDSVSQWDSHDWDPAHDEMASRRARRLLSRSDSRFHRFGDRFGRFRAWLAGERWIKRLAIIVVVLMAIFAGGFGALWWRLGAGPVNLDMVTPWLAAAIEENIGHDNTVEIGGTQIERAGRIRIAVRIRDVVVRDRDHAVIASAPKAEVKIFVVASAEVRARRRAREFAGRGETVDEAAVLDDIKKRDERDQNRAAAPLKAAPDAHVLDTTDLDVEGAVRAAIAIVEKVRAGR